MLDLYKRNCDSGVLIHTTDPGGKYGMGSIFMNGVDQTCGNILTFAIGMFSEGSDKTSFRWFFDKFNEKCSMIRKPLKNVTCEIN